MVFNPALKKARGVKLLPGAKVTALLGKKSVHAVRLNSGREVPADFVVAGIWGRAGHQSF